MFFESTYADSYGRKQSKNLTSVRCRFTLLVMDSLANAPLVEAEIYQGFQRHGAVTYWRFAILSNHRSIERAKGMDQGKRKRKKLAEQINSLRRKPLCLLIRCRNVSILVGEAGKAAEQNGVEMEQNRICSWLKKQLF